MRPKTLQQQLERDGEAFYSFGDDQLGEWQALAQTYKTSNASATTIPEKFDGLDLTTTGSSTGGAEEGNSDGKKLRDRCKSVAGKVPGGENHERETRQLRAWCVKPKTRQGS